MTIAVDANIIIRALTEDDPEHAAIAIRTLEDADQVAFPIVALCETVWVLRKAFKWPGVRIAEALRTLLDDPRAETEWDLFDAGLSILDAGGDFADGVIAAEGRKLGATRLATFDRDAATLLEASGEPVLFLG